MFSAIVLSAHAVTLQLPGCTVLPRVQRLQSVAQLHGARLDALAHVRTPYCFFLDDDDALPADYQDVLGECVKRMRAKKVPMAYTDEILREPGKADVHRSWYDYDAEQHAISPMAIHHLVVMDSKVVRDLAADLPRGDYWTEHMLYWALAQKGAVYVPRVGYIWNRNPSGFSRMPQILGAQVMSRRWIAMQQGVTSC
jgi:hypothetical protein